MEKCRILLNTIKNILNTRVNYILKVYDSIETDEHYRGFISMCESHLEFANFWQDKLKPKWYEFLNREKHKVYNDYCYFAQDGLNKLQSSINVYNKILQEEAEKEEYINEIKKKLTAEYLISKELQESNDALTKKKAPKIGFVTSTTKKKRKYNKKKNDKEKLDNTDSRSTSISSSFGNDN